MANCNAGEYVIPGNIIFRQRGTAWFPGENCKFGRDHCIFATESGYVRYYRDPRKHPKRQYIGVALEKDHTLPYPPNAARRRRLNMLAVPITSPTNPSADAVIVTDLQVGDGTGSPSSVRDTPREATRKGLTLTNGQRGGRGAQGSRLTWRGRDSGMRARRLASPRRGRRERRAVRRHTLACMNTCVY